MNLAVVKQLNQLQKKPEKFWGSNGIQTHDLRDTGAMLYQLSHEVLLKAGQVRVQFIPVEASEFISGLSLQLL